MYLRGADNAVWQRRYDGTLWSGWSSLGGKTYASPAASARRGTSIVDVFVRGTDNAIYHRYRNGTTWSSGWASIGAPPGGATSAPAAISNSTGRIDVFVRGGDSAIWRRTWTTSWSPWTSVGGLASSAPAVASRGTNRLDLFMRGSDGQIYRSFNDGAGWSSWSSLGGVTRFGPRGGGGEFESHRSLGPRFRQCPAAQGLAVRDRLDRLEHDLVRRPEALAGLTR